MAVNMKMIQQMQNRLEKIQRELAETIIEGTSGGGVVTAQVTGAREFHVVGTRAVESPMRFRNERVFMGGTLRPPEYSRQSTDPATIRRIRAGAE